MHPASETVFGWDEAALLQSYRRLPLCLAEGKGCRAQSPEGKSYLDFTSGIGVNSLGWADEEWCAAVAAQAATLQHTSNLYYTAPGAQLARALCEKTSMKKVFFANSGAEANEAAIKAARKYSYDKYGPGRATVISLQNSFHGRTLAALAATGQQAFHPAHFAPLPAGFVQVPPGSMAALEAAAAEGEVCAVLAEPVQGEGGVAPLGAGYMQALAAFCHARDILLIADEVQTGVGRCGAFLASELYGVTPDIVTLAKGLGGGLPIGAVLFGEACEATLGPGEHATTFGANPVCCAGACVVMARLSDGFLAGVAARGRRLRAGLAALPGIAAVSGEGLMLGAQLQGGLSAAEVLGAALQNGLLLLTAKDRLRFLPPLVISEAEIDEGLCILETTMRALL